MSAEPGYEWTCITDHAPFAARDGAGALVHEVRMWLLGGWNPGDREHFPADCNNEVWSSDDGEQWVLETLAAAWPPRHTAGYAVHNGRMWVVGSDAIQKRYYRDVWSSSDGREWALVCEDAPWGYRVLHHTVAFDGRLWVMGGQTLPQFAPGPERHFGDVWCSEDGVDWECVNAQAPWPARGMIGGSAVLAGRMWLLGGGIYDTPAHPERVFYNDVWSSADGREWECHTSCAPWAPRQYHEVAVFDGRLWVLEGWNYGNRNDVWHSRDGREWTQLPGTPWAPRHAASVFVYSGGLWVVAGNNMTSDVWKLSRFV